MHVASYVKQSLVKPVQVLIVIISVETLISIKQKIVTMEMLYQMMDAQNSVFWSQDGISLQIPGPKFVGIHLLLEWKNVMMGTK